MIVENLRIGRVVLHEVFQRKDGPNAITPAYGVSLETLDHKAVSHFAARIADALSAQSKSIEMKLVKTGVSSLLHHARQLIAAEDDSFVQASRPVADGLADAQKSRGIPGGMLLVFDGTLGPDNRPFFGVIKAEFQAGFRRSKTATAVVTEFIENIFLTPATRLYKLALFIADEVVVSDDTNWRAFVFDSNITSARREGAAVYFYDGFLGCAIPEDGKYETPKFFDLTKEFVRASVKDADLKRDLHDALFAFVKVDQNPTFTSQEFAEAYLPLELRDPYKVFLDSKKFPTHRAVVRDVSQMAGRLKRRKFRFGTDIEFSASPEAMRRGDATIETIAPPADAEPGTHWSRITIKRPLTEQL